jgi:BirA family biotin operon repressor/biotin-[acetyl-CoA-carboxylase] ligase
MERDDLLARAGLVVYADEQTDGRGRKNRRWHGIRGNLFVTLVIHPELSNELLSAVPLFAGLATHHTIWNIMKEQDMPGTVSIKWPNDVMIDNRKVAGILCESKHLNDITAIATGIGINIKGVPSDFPAELAEKITTLEANGIESDRNTILAMLLDYFDDILELAHTGGVRELFNRWNSLSSSIGKNVEYTFMNRKKRGCIEGIDHIGRLKVRSEDGVFPVISGEVRYL